MNPFRVACTTCNARLKVVDPAAIGQILACPKCGSMVQVAPPPGWTADAPVAGLPIAPPVAVSSARVLTTADASEQLAPSKDSARVGKSVSARPAGSRAMASSTAIQNAAAQNSVIQVAADHIAAAAHEAASVLNDKPRLGSGQAGSSGLGQSSPAKNSSVVLSAKQRADVKNSDSKPRAEIDKGLPGRTNAAAQAIRSVNSPAAIPVVLAAESIAATPLELHEGQPTVVVPSRWFWPALTAMAVLCLAVVGIEVSLSHRGNNESTLATQPDASRPEGIAKSALSTIRSAAAPEKEPPVASQSSVRSPADVHRAKTEIPFKPNPPEPNQAVVAIATPAATTSAPNSAPTPAAIPALKAPLSKIATSPGSKDRATAGFQPGSAFQPNAGPLADATTVGNPEPAANQDEPTVVAVQKPAIPPVLTPPEAAHPAPALGADGAANAGHPQPLRPSIERIPPRDVDVEARLTDSLPGIDFQNVPLWRFVERMSQISTIPITLDLDQLLDLGLSADSAVSVHANDGTVAVILEEALNPRGLGWRVVNHQLLVGRAPSAPVRRVRFAVADLTGGGKSSNTAGSDSAGGGSAIAAAGERQFAEMVRKLVEPESWKEAGGVGLDQWSDGALMVEQSDTVHSQLLVLCEKLRVARHLPLRSHGDPERFRLETRTQRAKAALTTNVTVNFARPEALSRILAYLGEIAHVRLLPDHIALAEEHMSVETEGFLSASHQPLGQSLAALLEPMGLTYRVVDEHTMEITTARAAASHPEIEFYPVHELLTSEVGGDALAARLLRELASAGLPNSAVQATTIYFDSPSQHLLVRAPQSTQLRVQALLGTWRVARE